MFVCSVLHLVDPRGQTQVITLGIQYIQDWKDWELASGSREMGQWVQTPVAKSDDLRLTSRTYRVGRCKLTPTSCVFPLSLTHAYTHEHTCTHTNSHMMASISFQVHTAVRTSMARDRGGWDSFYFSFPTPQHVTISDPLSPFKLQVCGGAGE